MKFLLYVAIAGVACLFDFAWVQYLCAVRDRLVLAASAWATWLYLASGVMTVAVISDHWVLLFGAIGSFFGTAAAVMHDVRDTH